MVTGTLDKGTAYPQADPKKPKKKVKGAKPTDKPHKAMAGIDGALFPGNKPMFNLSSDIQGTVLLGIPEADYGIAEAALQKRMKELGIVSREATEQFMNRASQHKVPLAAPLKRYPTGANPNPNAHSKPSPLDDPSLSNALDYLRKKNGPSGPLG